MLVSLVLVVGVVVFVFRIIASAHGLLGYDLVL